MLVSPTSRGTLKLRSSSSQDAPILDPNLLSNELDTQLLYACGRLTISMMQGPAGQKYGAREYGVDESIRNDLSDEALQKRLFYASRSLNHGSGTCAMGTVVDSECRVKGLEGVRVVDASIFPNPLGAHYQAAVYAIAEMVCGDLLAHSENANCGHRWQMLLLKVRSLEMPLRRFVALSPYTNT
jgi:choline dehydrogenase-like flavoprotein